MRFDSVVTLHVRADQPGTTGLHAALALDFDQADAAGSGRFQPRIVAQRRDLDPHAVGHVQHGFAFVGVVRLAVQLDFERFRKWHVDGGFPCS